MTMNYSPATAGGWLALCAATNVLLLGDIPADSVRDELLEALDDTAGLGHALDLLVRNGLATLPPFALLSLTGEGARLIVRGGVTVTVASKSGSETVDGVGVTTWTERVIAAATSLSVSVAGAAPVPGVGSLQLGSGAAWVADLWLGATEPAKRIAPAPDKAPVAENPAPSVVEPVEAPPVEDPETTVVELPAEVAPEPEPATAPATGGEYDYLFGETLFRGVADAAVRVEPEPEPSDEPADSSVGDHDGETILVSELPTAGDHDGETIMTSTIAKLRAGRKRKKALDEPPPPAAPKVVLVLSNGTREALEQPILVGRAPSLAKTSSDPIPKLVVIGTADQDISRTHARIALEGGTVVVTDLHSRNGTMVALPGKEPQKLRAGDPTSVLVGSVIDFGGGVTITVQEES